jgi:hypothetical protein
LFGLLMTLYLFIVIFELYHVPHSIPIEYSLNAI